MKYFKASLLSALLLFSSFSPAFHAQAWAVDKKNFSTIELMTSTVDVFPNCLYYCITGISARLVKKVPPKIIFTLEVEHNMSDAVVTAERRLQEMPWLEWNAIFGTAYTLSTFGLLQGVAAVLGLPMPTELGGSQTRYVKRGDHQSTTFKDSEIIGHPMTAIVKMMRTDGTVDASKAPGSDSSGGGGGGGLSMPDFQAMWNKWLSGAISSMPNMILDALGLKAAFEMLAQAQAILNLAQSIMEIIDLASGYSPVGGVKIDSLFCPNQVVVAAPYFLSGMDAILWREGYPITDIHKTLTILNPLSGDRIKPSSGAGLFGGLSPEAPAADLPLISSLYLWGNLYPRSGFVNNPEDHRVAAVVASRSSDILESSGGGHLGKGLPGSAKPYAWNQVHPSPGSCRKNITHTISEDNQQGSYAWNYWRRYKCDLTEKGKHLFTIKIPKICLTPDVPD